MYVSLPLATALALHPWDLVRVDQPDHPEADASSDLGSVLLAPPSDPALAWRPEAVPEVDGWSGAVEPWETFEALAVQPWHDAGHLGAGVKIAVFDLQWFHSELADDELGWPETHDCYRHRSCAQPIDTLDPRFTFEEGTHGRACAEVIADIAPEAELHLVRVNGLTTLENAIAWAVREEIDLISMSLSFLNESFYDGTGPVNATMDALSGTGTLMVTSAGNYAEQHHGGVFTDDDGDGWHEFGSDRETLDVWFPAGEHRLFLVWDEFDRCGRTDLDVTVTDAAGRVVGRSLQSQSQSATSCQPVERARVVMASEGWTDVAIHTSTPGGRPAFDLLARGGEVSGGRAAGSVTDPGSHPAALSVGAVRARGYLLNGAEGFSSVGPTNAGIPKPELAGPDGLSTETTGGEGFYGTSAAAPAVTGALALLMSADPTLDSHAAAALLRATAVRPETLWAEPDPALGDGHARLPPPTAGSRGCLEGALVLALLLPLPGLRRRPDAPPSY